jgi:hypothetical protein
MTDMILERSFEPAISTAFVLELAMNAAGCFGIHAVEWKASYLGLDGRRMLCHFSAPDMESTRIALRQVDADTSRLWRASVHDAPGAGAADIASANVIVERDFADAVELQDIQNIEDAGIHCLEMRNVRFARTFFATDRKRMLCLYAAPDAESVRQAQREAGVPFTEAWAFTRCGPEHLEQASG